MTSVDEVDFDVAGFDAVVSLYALIHMPVTDQPGVIARAARWLRPGGLFVATVGHTAWTGTESDWLRGGADMLWSHPGAATYRAWIESAGLAIDNAGRGLAGLDAVPAAMADDLEANWEVLGEPIPSAMRALGAQRGICT